MNKWVRWNRWVVGGLVASAISVVGFNLLLDPYSVFRTAEWMRQGYNVNERFRKIEYLRHHIGKHDSFIIGASTMGLFPVDEAQRLRPGRHWYNLSFLAGTPPEALRALKFLHAQGAPIAEVMMGIDIFAFRKLGDSTEMWKREHPLVVGDSWTHWYKANLFASSFVFGVERVVHNLNPAPRLYFDIEGTGRYHLPRWDKEIARDPAAFIQKQIYERNKNGGKEIQRSGIVLIQERFDELAELKSWLDANGIRNHFWINPMHWKNIATITPEALTTFRRMIKQSVGDIPDYSLRTDFTQADNRFYEWQHFLPSTANLIVKEILGSQQDNLVASR